MGSPGPARAGCSVPDTGSAGLGASRRARLQRRGAPRSRGIARRGRGPARARGQPARLGRPRRHRHGGRRGFSRPSREARAPVLTTPPHSGHDAAMAIEEGQSGGVPSRADEARDRATGSELFARGRTRRGPSLSKSSAPRSSTAASRRPRASVPRASPPPRPLGKYWGRTSCGLAPATAAPRPRRPATRRRAGQQPVQQRLCAAAPRRVPRPRPRRRAGRGQLLARVLSRVLRRLHRARADAKRQIGDAQGRAGRLRGRPGRRGRDTAARGLIEALIEALLRREQAGHSAPGKTLSGGLLVDGEVHPSRAAEVPVHVAGADVRGLSRKALRSSGRER